MSRRNPSHVQSTLSMITGASGESQLNSAPQPTTGPLGWLPVLIEAPANRPATVDVLLAMSANSRISSWAGGG